MMLDISTLDNDSERTSVANKVPATGDFGNDGSAEMYDADLARWEDDGGACAPARS